MASRNIADCSSFMQQKWEAALLIWREKYPGEPEPFLTCTHRTNEQQAALYAKGRTQAELNAVGLAHVKPGGGAKVTWALPGESKHNKKPSQAFDIAFLKKGSKKECDWSLSPFRKFAAIIKPMGVEWGGDWPGRKNDSPHFQERK